MANFEVQECSLYFINQNNNTVLLASTGNFTVTQIDLGFNEFAVFEEGVFKDILQQMISVQLPIGYINIEKSMLFHTFISQPYAIK